MGNLRLEWESRPSKIRATANLDGGWRQLTNTFGFCEEELLILPADWQLRVQIKLHAWPIYRGKWRDEFPLITDLRGKSGPFDYELSGSVLKVWIDLELAKTMNLPHSNNPGFYEGPFCLMRHRGVAFYLHLLVVLRRPGPVQPGDLFETDVQFWQGGLPGLGRRR